MLYKLFALKGLFFFGIHLPLISFSQDLDSIKIFAVPKYMESAFSLSINSFSSHCYQKTIKSDDVIFEFADLIGKLKSSKKEWIFEVRIICHLYYNGKKSVLAMNKKKQFEIDGVFFKKNRKLFRLIKKQLPNRFWLSE